jgi:hypothetical protein
MTPVTGGITDREKNRLVAVLSLGERIRAPGPPIDRVVLMLEKIRTGLCGETVAAPLAGVQPL